ncbi:hypothetical protein B9Z55_020637 [Caenorhabditis nigoni]|nr:hypothetical protein B9Z55_020637 [Caenorhabditis nigoni]
MSERTTMLENEPQTLETSKPSRAYIYFTLGFVLSTIFAFIAYGLSQGIFHWFIEEKHEVCEKRIIGYYDLSSSREVTELQLSKFTHLVLFPLNLQSPGKLEFRNDEEKENFLKTIRKAKLFRLKTIFSVWDENRDYEVIEDVLDDSRKRLTLLNSITDFIKEHQLDGVEVYWRWFRTKQESLKFSKFCQELRSQLSSIISITFAPHSLHYQTDFSEILKHVNFMSIDTNNYYGSWKKKFPQLVGPSSPLYSGHQHFENQNMDSTMKKYICSTNKPNRLNMMVEFTGRYWHNVIVPRNLKETNWPVAETKNGNIEGGAIPRRNFEYFGWNVLNTSWNDESRTAFIWKPDERSYMTFENEKSLGEKIRYAIDNNIGGLAFWRFDHDDDNMTLLNVLAAANLCSGKDNKLEC